jgi:hypothetical protein
VKETDRSTNTGIIKEVLSQHDGWKGINKKRLGFAYDGKSALYTTSLLTLTKDTESDYIQMDVNFPPMTSSTFHVVISKVAEILPPRSNSELAEPSILL